jgi:hypothetical protein
MHVAYGVIMIAYLHQYMPRPEPSRSWREILKCMDKVLKRFGLNRNQGVSRLPAVHVQVR